MISNIHTCTLRNVRVVQVQLVKIVTIVSPITLHNTDSQSSFCSILVWMAVIRLLPVRMILEWIIWIFSSLRSTWCWRVRILARCLASWLISASRRICCIDRERHTQQSIYYSNKQHNNPPHPTSSLTNTTSTITVVYNPSYTHTTIKRVIITNYTIILLPHNYVIDNYIPVID